MINNIGIWNDFKKVFSCGFKKTLVTFYRFTGRNILFFPVEFFLLLINSKKPVRTPSLFLSSLEIFDQLSPFHYFQMFYPGHLKIPKTKNININFLMHMLGVQKGKTLTKY